MTHRLWFFPFICCCLLVLLAIFLDHFATISTQQSVTFSQAAPRMNPTTDTFQPPAVPRDSEGYVKSFDIVNYTEADAIAARAFFEQYGFVVFANVFTPEQCAATIVDIWDVIEFFVGQPVRHDENLWTPK